MFTTIIFTALISIALAFWTRRTVEYLFNVPCPYWVAFIVTLLFTGPVLIINVVVEVIRLFSGKN